MNPLYMFVLLLLLTFVLSLFTLTMIRLLQSKSKRDVSPMLKCNKKKMVETNLVEMNPDEMNPDEMPPVEKEAKETCPNMDDYVRRTQLKPNMVLRNNPYYIKNKCKTCDKTGVKKDTSHTNTIWVPGS